MLKSRVLAWLVSSESSFPGGRRSPSQCIVACPFHTDFSRGRSDGLVFPFLPEFSSLLVKE